MVNFTDIVCIQLSAVQLVARFPVKEVLQKLYLEAEAVLQFSKASVILTGVYSPGRLPPYAFLF